MKDKITRVLASSGMVLLVSGFLAFWGGVIYLVWAAGSFLMGAG